MKCRVCKVVLSPIEDTVCRNCIFVEHYKCMCGCQKKFSFAELQEKGIKESTKVKCTTVKNVLICFSCRKKVDFCMKKPRFCWKCVKNYQKNLENTVKKFQQQILEAQKEIYALSSEMYTAKSKLRTIHANVCTCDPLNDRLETLYCQGSEVKRSLRLMMWKKRNIQKEFDESERDLHTHLKMQNKLAKKMAIGKQALSATFTFLLCGVRPEVRHYIDRPLQKHIVRLVLSEAFLI